MARPRFIHPHNLVDGFHESYAADLSRPASIGKIASVALLKRRSPVTSRPAVWSFKGFAGIFELYSASTQPACTPRRHPLTRRAGRAEPKSEFSR